MNTPKHNEKYTENEINSLIASFHDTMTLVYAKPLGHATKKAVESSRIYKDGFVSGAKPGKNCADIVVEENTTFASAKKYLKVGKVAVLNFANPQTPGGGVERGAMAQEECLCRSSNLFPCLNAEGVFADYYGYHQSMHTLFFSDRLIYTKGVTVFKNDAKVPEMMPKKEWFTVDVITCAAPYLAKCKHMNAAVLKEMFKSRIRNIFEAACDNKVDVLILGAFGCGAFKNPPGVVAAAFDEVIEENLYRQKFKKIVFAIKPSRSEKCPNVQAFRGQFNSWDQDDVAVLDDGDSYGYRGKIISILGDSISTLEGYNPAQYKVYYGEELVEKSGVRTMQDTWWGRVIETLGGDLLVNNAWSGSRVTRLPGTKELFPSGCSDERTFGLHIDKVMPDVIIVYLGTNDWGFGADDFYEAYDVMLKKLKVNYPKAEIWCCTLCTTYMAADAGFKFPYKYLEVHIDELNGLIRRAVFQNGCRLIDLYEQGRPYDSMDGIHPTVRGMEELAEMVVRVITGADKGMQLPTLRLSIVSKNEDISINDTFIRVGRAPDCDICLTTKVKRISRRHAVFCYSRGVWYVQDTASTNGTWLNGERLQPGKKYSLKQNDIINLASEEKLIFDRTEEVTKNVPEVVFKFLN